MSDCDQFHHGSRRRQICEGTSGLPKFRENLFRAKYGLGPLPEEPRELRAESSEVAVRVRVTERQAGKAKKTGCCGKGATKNGIAATRNPQNLIQSTPSRIKRISRFMNLPVISRAVQYATAMAKHIADDGTPTAPADLTFRESCCATCPHNVNDTCQLCNCPLHKNLLNQGKLAWRSETCPVGRWFRQTDKSQPLVDPIRNLIFHIYPRFGCEWNWHRHVQHIRDNDHIWNGKRIISIMTGEGLTPPETVQRQFDGIRVDRWIVMPNMKPIGETAPFILCLKQVESVDPNEITMFGHTKGITHDRNGKEQIWSEIMWQVCLDLHSVQEAISSHWCAGPFKRHMRLLKSSWHYSGHFLWLRNKDVFSRPWQSIVQQRAGMEGWAGSFIDNRNAACLFHDNPPVNFLDQNYWDTEILPEFEHWKESRGLV